MWNTPSKITKYQHKWINANNEAKPLRVKDTIRMTFLKIIKKGNKRNIRE